VDLNPGEPQDVYQLITNRVIKRLKQDADEYAARLINDGNDYACITQAYDKYSLLKPDYDEYRRLKKMHDKCERRKHKMEPDLKKAYDKYKKKKITLKLNKAYAEYKRLKKQIAAEDADWWLWVGITRKLIKRPAMTFAYSVTEYGMKEQLVETYGEIHAEPGYVEVDGKMMPRGGPAPTDDAAWYLAKHIKAAAEEILKRPTEAMKFFRALSDQCVDKGKVLEWTSPTGFPCANRYYESKVQILHLELRGEYVRNSIAGCELNLSKVQSRNGVAPNFVHSLDASHLIKVANTAAGEGIGIAVVHDSFGCLAPHAERLHKIIREEMAKLYDDSRDVLADLRTAAGSSLELPKKGTPNPGDVRRSTYAFA
jgi:DNA-directed RNA polymerase